MSLPTPQPVPLSTSFPFGLDEAWDQTDEGHATIYAMNPALIPAAQVARVIYELRLDVARLNDEVIEQRGDRFLVDPPE